MSGQSVNYLHKTGNCPEIVRCPAVTMSTGVCKNLLKITDIKISATVVENGPPVAVPCTC